MKPNIEINIDELILHGFSRSEGYAIKKSLIQNLNTLFVQGNVQASMLQDLSLRNLTLPTINTRQSVRPEQIGSSLADQLYQKITSPSTMNNV